MSQILPFVINPGVGLDHATAYWYVTMCRLAYLRDDAMTQTAVQAAGGTGFIRQATGAPLVPHSLVCFFPGARAVVIVEGTTAWQQWLLHAMGSIQGPVPPWTGTVNTYFVNAVHAIWNATRPVLEGLGILELAVGGHSFGGAVCVLLEQLVAGAPGYLLDGLVTAGSPRVGSLLFAIAQTRPHLRLTNSQDPVPYLPPSTNSFLDAALSLAVPVNVGAYRHSGERYNLWPDGSSNQPAETPSWIEGYDYLVNVVSTGDSWFSAHNPSEYGRRLREAIPVRWLVESPAWPNLHVLDQVNAVLSGADPWPLSPPVCFSL